MLETIVAVVVTKAITGATIYSNKYIKSNQKFDLKKYLYGLAGAFIVGVFFVALGMNIESDMYLILSGSVVAELMARNVFEMAWLELQKIANLKK